jgi:hypothetical protein
MIALRQRRDRVGRDGQVPGRSTATEWQGSNRQVGVTERPAPGEGRITMGQQQRWRGTHWSSAGNHHLGNRGSSPRECCSLVPRRPSPLFSAPRSARISLAVFPPKLNIVLR